jgi:hypothetical protein
MAYSDLNYASPKVVKAVFGLTDAKFAMLVVEGKFRLKRKYKNPLIYMDSIASMYEDRDTVVLKRWGYDYETPKEKYAKMLDTQLKGYPRCFFKVQDVPEAFYRVFYRGVSFKLCVYVFDGFLRCICFDRGREEQMEFLYKMFEEGKVDVEG